MQILAGTSGFSYAEWKGRFYPEGTPEAQMLRYYGEHLPSVEINNTFYRMPKPESVQAWGKEVPAAFRFAVKASRRITHQQKLSNVGDDVRHLFEVAGVLGDKLGPILFQLPPFFRKDLGVLRAFLGDLPKGRRCALEFRHPSWFEEDVYAALSEHNVALVGGDLEELEKSPPLVATADFGYLRLRRLDYEPAIIREWATRITEQKWQAAYTYFKHEVLGPMFAEALIAHVAGRDMADLSELRARLATPVAKVKKASARPKSPASKRTPAAPASEPAQLKAARVKSVPSKPQSSRPPTKKKPS